MPSFSFGFITRILADCPPGTQKAFIPAEKERFLNRKQPEQIKGYDCCASTTWNSYDIGWNLNIDSLHRPSGYSETRPPASNHRFSSLKSAFGSGLLRNRLAHRSLA